LTDTILRELPPNPNLLNYHTRRQLTTLMSERYTLQSSAYPEKWIQSLCQIDGITGVHLLRHQIRLRKADSVDWEQLIEAVENRLRFHWKEIAIKTMTDRTEPRRRFALPTAMSYQNRKVIEGVDQSKSIPLAAELYKIHGITTLIFYQQTITVKRGFNFSWKELSPQIIRVLKHYSPGE
jgi:hypothetical protein